MQKIIAPLQLKEQNDAVANVQDALRVIINGELLDLDPGIRRFFSPDSIRNAATRYLTRQSAGWYSPSISL